MVDEAALMSALRLFAMRSVEDYDVGTVLDELGEQARTVLGLQGAGVTLLVREGTSQTKYITATDPATFAVEAAQDDLEQGACIESISLGHPVTADDITDFADRWPDYTPVVLDAGFRAVAGIPMVAAGRVVGALNAYRAEPGAWSRHDVETASVFASVATAYIANAAAYRDQAALSSQLQRALDSRVLIEQAKGVLAERNGVTLQQAFEAMRAHARAQRVRVEEVATAVLSGGHDLPLAPG
jgi:GAF domain-containing protein